MRRGVCPVWGPPNTHSSDSAHLAFHRPPPTVPVVRMRAAISLIQHPHTHTHTHHAGSLIGENGLVLIASSSEDKYDDVSSFFIFSIFHRQRMRWPWTLLLAAALFIPAKVLVYQGLCIMYHKNIHHHSTPCNI